MTPTIHGTCAPRFAAVRDAFAANFAAGREVGASFAATVDGELVVDLWAGHADAARTRPWERDTIRQCLLDDEGDDRPLGPNPRTFGHGGWGGSLGFADLDARVSWAYVMNKMSPGTTGDTRAAGPLMALYASL